MGVGLTKGGNVSLAKEAPGMSTVLVGIGWTAAPDVDLDASALLCDASGRVVSDEHFVFFNNLRSPDGSVRHLGSASAGGAGGDREQIEADLPRVPAGVERIVFAVAIYDAAGRNQSFRQVRAAHVRLTDQATGAEIARYDLTGGTDETAMVFGELYRHGGDWKFRAVGQGYASGLAGIAADFGVEVLQPSAPPAPPPAPVPLPPLPTPTPAPAPVAATSLSQTTSGSSAMTCFFDPSHGIGATAVLWSPQWGVPRQVQTCGACAQRVQTTPPPFYTPQQAAGYPQPVQQGYPQQGYAQVPGQGQPDGGGRRFGTGALIGAGAAGLVGGALLNEAFSDDEPDVIVNNYYED
ncbi:TerD family protein [Kitasatospora sp. NPDC004799]|uniref:TerD family protein n=1 Tax=Kitasatospora sp. NPDC004799 TaxID=3154460 RepID=UPI0033AF8D0C